MSNQTRIAATIPTLAQATKNLRAAVKHEKACASRVVDLKLDMKKASTALKEAEKKRATAEDDLEAAAEKEGE